VRIAASSCGCAAALLLALALAGCATPPADPAEHGVFDQTNDPLEPLNRTILDVNQLLDRILLKPVAKVYIAIVPEEGRDALRRALDNMKEPVVVINNVLQAEPNRAAIAAGRFGLNTTFGVAGLFDVAEKWGLDKQNGDFGQTLFVWGLPEGPYLILPVLGPSNPRDAVGLGIDAYSDPFNLLATSKALDQIQITRFVLGGVDERARVIDVLDDLEKNSLDFYAQLRSLAQQRRAAELRHGAAPSPGANFYDDPGKAASAPRTTPLPRPPHPVRSAAVRCSISRTSASAPPRCSTEPNSERRVANSLTVPLR
jgi:phospholipid-binding lipoprotein MlaA